MGAVRATASRVFVVGASLLALLAGITLGSTGCALCNCRNVEVLPIGVGVYEIRESTQPELVGGIVEVVDDAVELSITDGEGNDHVISYAVVD